MVEHLKRLHTELQSESKDEEEVNILLVSHGGWISNFYKVCFEDFKGEKVWAKAKNCKLHLFKLSANLMITNLQTNVTAKELNYTKK